MVPIPGGDIGDAVDRSARLDRYCADLGRDPAEIGRSIFLPVSYERPPMVGWFAAEDPQRNYHGRMTAMAPVRAEADLSFLLDRTSHVLRTRMAAALAEIGLTARMHCVLVHALEEERTQAQLAVIGDMDKTTMVVTVDALERAGLAERRPSAADRRARIIAVTDKGREVAERSQRIVDGVHRAALGSLPAEDREVLVRALRNLTEGHLAEAVEAPSAARRARQ